MNMQKMVVTVPRMNGKRLSVMRRALQHAKEGNRVLIFDVGGENKILEPLEDGNIVLIENKLKDDEE